MNPTANILQTIVEHKQAEIRRLPSQSVTGESLRAAWRDRGNPRDFMAALRCTGSAGIALIAEVKKASPSAGLLCPDFDPVRIAREYAAAGAQCLSVLTDERFFQGSLEYLKKVRQAVSLPLLRKDFLLDPRQILEAIEWGADAILLIVSILTDGQLRDLLALAQQAGLAVLVEVHDEGELDRAIGAGARLIGVNNRNLRDFSVNLATTEKLAARLRQTTAPGEILLVSESGIHTRPDVERLIQGGVHAMLVGESLVKQQNIHAKVRELLFA